MHLMPTRPSGSSPLSRGIRAADDDGDEGRGIIPALAGNTGSAAALAVTTRDHPRSRGEYMARCCAQFTESGSSPLSRGIRTGGSDDDQHGRIIPALAGNTPSRCRSSARHPDHPRSRGEYLSARFVEWMMAGSSPLSRGILDGARLHRRPCRIIPALAGNTPARRRRPARGRDHPRSRGE